PRYGCLPRTPPRTRAAVGARARPGPAAQTAGRDEGARIRGEPRPDRGGVLGHRRRRLRPGRTCRMGTEPDRRGVPVRTRPSPPPRPHPTRARAPALLPHRWRATLTAWRPIHTG